MKDTAYTSLPLGPHTDTTYFTDPAGLQMFHLLSHTAGEGGKSLLVDGFKAYEDLRTRHPEAASLLAKYPVSSHASGNEGVTITPAKKFPVFNFADGLSSQRLLQVRWNNDDRGVLGLEEVSSGHTWNTQNWYWAARLWNETINRKDMQYWAQLEPGRPLSTTLFSLQRT
jgi:trimethyllysine dioxygenase